MGAAVELLRKGATLVKESCSTCGGVQVKYSGKIICVNCGKEEEIAKVATEAAPTEEVVNNLKNTVLAKIGELLPSLKSESDIIKQSDLAKLIIYYLEILEKVPKVYESRQ